MIIKLLPTFSLKIKTEQFIVSILLLFGSTSFIGAQNPLYFNIISHNEESDTFNYENSIIEYNLVKTVVKRLCDTIISKNAKYNMQVDANFIFGALNHENAASNPTDILEWANNTSSIDVDGHNHFVPMTNPYNYSDLAHLLDSCGVNLTRKVLGGVTYADTTIGPLVMQENWTQYSTPKAGYSFPNFLWQAEIVWGTASPGHVADYTKFGIWKPQGGSSPNEFGMHDPNGTITHVGGGCKEDVGFILLPNGQQSHTTNEIIANIKQTVDYIQTLTPSSNDFYTMNMLINFRDMPNIPGFVDSISLIIDGIQDYVDQGKIIWATIAEKHDWWYAAHSDPNDFFKFDCAEVPLSTTETSKIESDVHIFPNPTTNVITVQFETAGEHLIEILSGTGEVLLNYICKDSSKIYLDHFSPGCYFVRVGYTVQKFIKI